jgi:putative SOS response-associated peptidase YedK
VKDGLIRDDLFAFLTTDPNNVVGAVHSKAMPVLLTTPEEVERWLNMHWEDAKLLQRPLPNGILEIVSRPVSSEA